MEIGRECWPLFLGFDVRSIGEKDHRQVHDHGNYAFGLDKARGRRRRLNPGGQRSPDRGTPSSVSAHRAS